MSESNETSLYSNLTQCLRALRKIREIYKKAPATILYHLANLEEVITLCQCASLEDDFDCGSTPPRRTSRTYWYILENLMEVSTPLRLPLQLYFCKSPYWEHYERNVTEIMSHLERILSARQLEQPSVSTAIANNESSDENEFAGVEKFKRKFVPFPKVVSDRQWGVGWPSKSLVL